MRKMYFIPLLASTFTFAQVGINNSEPKASLDVTAKTTDGTAAEGIIAPRLTGDQIKLADIQYTTAQKGVIVYATAAVSTIIPGSKTQNITSEGYYYFDGNLWQKFANGNLVNYTAGNGLSLDANEVQLGGTLSKNTVVAQGTNNLAFTSNATSGTSHFSIDGTTFNVNAFNNRIGIGTNAPLTSFQFVGDEARIGGPSTQTGTLPNPMLRIHSNANVDGSGGRIYFNEDNTGFGYYLQHNTGPGTTWGEDAILIGAYGGGSHAFSPNHPGISVNRWQNVGVGTNWALAKFHIDAAEDNPINNVLTAAQEANDVVVTNVGNVGIGTTTPQSKLEINGASTNKSAYNAGSGNVIDFAASNLAYTTASAGVFTLSGVKDGGTYTLSVRGTTSGTSTFTATGFTVKYINNGATTAGKETLYTFIVIATTIYAYMASGF